MVADLKTAQEVRDHAIKVQRRINAQLHQKPVEIKKEVAEDPVTVPVHPVVRIIEFTAAYYKLKPEDITGPKRTGPTIIPRYICYFISKRFGFTWLTIGRHCKRDHTTALHGTNVIFSRILSRDEAVIRAVNMIGVKAATQIFRTNWKAV